MANETDGKKTGSALLISNDLYKNQDNGKIKGSSGTSRFFHVNGQLLPLKITLFLFYGAMSAILPYLTIHMKYIGISLSQIGIIYAVLPITAFLGPPIMGFMADKMGKYKLVLIVSTIISGVFYTSLLAVPRYSESPINTTAVIEFRPADQGGTILRPEDPSLCDNFKKALTTSFRNQIINVHSCSSNVTIISRGIQVHPGTQPGWWHLPGECLFEGDTEEVDVLSCGDQAVPDGNNSMIMSEVGGRAKRSPVNTCQLKVRLNSGPPPASVVVCKTNFTFPTGEKIAHGNNALTFWLYFFLRNVGNVFSNACFSLLDATTLTVVKNTKGAEYGKERIFCTLGFALISPLAGLLVDLISGARGFTDYSAAFYLADILLICNILGYFFMKLEVEKPSEDFWKHATDLLKYPEVIVFLGMIFILGNMWGFVESYLFIFLDELHAPKYLLGLTMTVGSLSSVPFLYGAENLVARAGRVNIIALAFIFYFVRFFGYSYIPNPFWCFPFEAMEAITYHLMWVAAATYCAILAPKGLLATLTGVMGSLHYGLGKGSGAFLGGYVISLSTTRLSFRYFGIFSGVFGIIYFLINKVWLEGAISKRNEKERAQEPEDKEQEEEMLRNTTSENSNKKSAVA